jgi:hypothetical protein
MRLVAHGLYDYTVDEEEVQGVSAFLLLSGIPIDISSFSIRFVCLHIFANWEYCI